jgi:hypothetical protein
VRAYFTTQGASLAPDIVLVSSDAPAQTLLRAAIEAAPGRVVYLVHATPSLPFGPDCVFAHADHTRRLAAAVLVGVSHYVAGYIERHAGLPAVHVPITFVRSEDWPYLGRFDNEFVTLVNPCALKGISIFLALADRFPDVAFAAVPTWGTNQDDLTALAARKNVTLLPRVDDINEILRRTRILLVPSLWAEAFGRVVLEAMLTGVPVLASDVGGIPEAKMGVPYVLPVNPIARYRSRLDDRLVPVADVPTQDVGPWREALQQLIGDRTHYETISSASRAQAVAYARNVTVEPFEALLQSVLNRRPSRDLHSAIVRES